MKAAQNPAQQAAAPSITERQETKQAAARERLMPPNATGCFLVQPAQVELDGLEQGGQTSGKSETPVQGGTVCGTADAQNSPLDPQLQLLIERWQALSPAVQQQMMLLVIKSLPYNEAATAQFYSWAMPSLASPHHPP